MVANSKSARLEGEPANDPAISSGDVASYVYLTARELEAMARNAGLADVAEALARASSLSAEALARIGAGGRA